MNILYAKYCIEKSKMLNFHLSEKRELKKLFLLAGVKKELLHKKLTKHNTSLLVINEVNNILSGL